MLGIEHWKVMMSDLIKRLRMGTQVPEFELRQEAANETERLRAALKEIRDVARCSDGVDFYAMLAEQALEGDDG